MIKQINNKFITIPSLHGVVNTNAIKCISFKDGKAYLAINEGFSMNGEYIIEESSDVEMLKEIFGLKSHQAQQSFSERLLLIRDSIQIHLNNLDVIAKELEDFYPEDLLDELNELDELLIAIRESLFKCFR